MGGKFHEDKTSIHWKHEPTLSYATTTATTSVLLPLSRLTGLGNFCFSLLSPFLSIVRILSSQATSFQILLYALFPRFLWSTLLPFPSYFKLITSRIWELMSQRMTRPYQHRRLSLIMSSIFTRTSTLSSWSYDALPSQPHLIGNSKFAHFTIIQQNWSNTTLVNLPRLVQK